MKNLIFIVSIIVSNLVIDANSQNCSFAQTALLSSQRSDKALQMLLDELRPPEYVLTIAREDPGFGVWSEASVAEPIWGDFRRARIMLSMTELVNHKFYFDKECNDLSSYTNCFSNASTDVCHNMTDLHCDTSPYRTLSGICNNLQNPKLGSQFAAYGHIIPPEYNDCIHSERRTFIDSIPLPPPRGIGNKLAENGFGYQISSNKSVLNIFGAICGQIITHDTGSRINVQRNNFFGPGIQCCSQLYTKRLSEEISHPACKPIDIPSNDPYFSKYRATCMNFISSQTTFSNDCKIGPAQQSNSVSSFMDLGIVYGDDTTKSNLLRTKSLGQLKTNAANVLPVTPRCQRQPCYFLGDGRLVETPMLAQWHSLFLRLHNYIAPLLNITDDETAFQEAKRLTTALYQRIVYNEWLPVILGQAESEKRQLTCNPTKVSCGKYNPSIDPSNTNEHTHGAFRWLHAFIPSVINFYDQNHKFIRSADLSDLNATTLDILEREYNDLLRGALFDPVNYSGYSPELRNKLFKDAQGMGIDLMSIDLARGRDHGVPPFHAFISFCKNTTVEINSWLDLDAYFSPASIRILQNIYKHPRDIDLLVGVLGERRSAPNALLGNIGTCIVSEQFKRFKFGDRFFYQWTDGPHPFTRAQFQEIEQFTMAKFLCTVTDLGDVPYKAFLTPSDTNPKVKCAAIPKFNINLFRK